MSGSSERFKSDLTRLTPRERLELARNSPIARKIVFTKQKDYLAKTIGEQTRIVREQLPERRTDAKHKTPQEKKRARKYALASYLLGLFIIKRVPILKELEELGPCIAQLLAGVVVYIAAYFFEAYLHREMAHLVATYGLMDEHEMVARLWMTRMDFCLEPLEQGVAEKLRTSPQDPHLQAAQSVLDELRQRQKTAFTEIVTGHELPKKFANFDGVAELNSNVLFHQGMTLLAQVGSTPHVGTSYRGGVRVAAEIRKDDGDTDTVTVPSDKLARKKAG